MADIEKIVLGSGDLYYKEFEGSIPENSVLETDENKLGYIQGGATIEYKPTYYTAKDDLGVVQKTIITEEESTLKSGILTFNGKTLAVLCETARVSESGNIRTVKIGGVKNANGKKYIIHFHHKDKVDGDIRLTIVGKNESGFSLAFAKDKETVIDAEFKCHPQDDDGTLIKYQEDIPAALKTIKEVKN